MPPAADFNFFADRAARNHHLGSAENVHPIANRAAGDCHVASFGLEIFADGAAVNLDGAVVARDKVVAERTSLI